MTTSELLPVLFGMTAGAALLFAVWQVISVTRSRKNRSDVNQKTTRNEEAR